MEASSGYRSENPVKGRSKLAPLSKDVINAAVAIRVETVLGDQIQYSAWLIPHPVQVIPLLTSDTKVADL
jgi:hypothetical protein